MTPSANTSLVDTSACPHTQLRAVGLADVRLTDVAGNVVEKLLA